jgi:hypothetical protein
MLPEECLVIGVRSFPLLRHSYKIPPKKDKRYPLNKNDTLEISLTALGDVVVHKPKRMIVETYFIDRCPHEGLKSW